jgi:hypothetical protein
MPGFVASLWTEPATGDGAVALANATSGVAVGELTHDLLRVLDEQEPPLPRAWTPSPVAPALLELTGTWYWGTAASTLAVEGSDLLRLTAADGRRSSRFRRSAEDLFVGLDSYYAGERLRVVRDDAGGISHLDLATFVFTRRPYEPVDLVPGGVDDRGWR